MPHLTAQAAELRALASTLERMPLASRSDPHAPHEARSEIVGAMKRLADKVEKGGGSAEPVEAPAPKPAVKPGKIKVDGRVIHVEFRRR